MPTVKDIELLVRDQRFQSIDDPLEKSSILSRALSEVYGQRFDSTDSDTQQKIMHQVLSDYTPRTTTENILSFVPIAGPLIEQYAYGRVVKASPLAQKIFGEGINQYGAAEQVVEDLALTLGSIWTLGQAAPGIAAAKTIGQIFTKEALTGGIFEVGKLLTTPPKSGAEAVERIATGAASFAVIGGGAGAIGHWFSARKNGLALLNEFGSVERVADVSQRMATGDVRNVTYDELEGMLRTASSKKGVAADEFRADMNARIRAKQAYDENFKLSRQSEIDSLSESMRQERIDLTTRENDLSYQEGLSRQLQAENYARDLASRRMEDATRFAQATEKYQIENQILRDRNLEAVQAEVDLAYRERRAVGNQHQAMLDEQARQTTVNKSIQDQINITNIPTTEAPARLAEIARVRQESAQLGRDQLTKSESMLIDALNSTEEAQHGFVGREPITLPMAMIADSPQGPAAVIVERFANGQAWLKDSNVPVSRTTLREPRTPAEISQLERFRQAQNVGDIPGREDGLTILRSRVAAEQAARMADAHATRPDFAINVDAQTNAFELRRTATMQMLEATNRQFSEQATTALGDVKALAGNRVLASVEGIQLGEANDVAKALTGSGFKHVRTSIDPNGRVGVFFTETDSGFGNEVSKMAARNFAKSDVLDATTRTYGGLTKDEHILLGRAYGIAENQIKKFTNLMDQTLNDMASRGIRVPATLDALGINPLELQSTGRSRAAQAIRPDAVSTVERLKRYETGDTVKYTIGNQAKNFQVSSVGWNDVTNTRQVFMQSIDKADFGAQYGPFTEDALRAAGAKLDVAKPIGADPTMPMSQYSPARNLDQIVSGENRPQLTQPVTPTYNDVTQNAKALGYQLKPSPDGGIELRSNSGLKIKLQSPGALEDAARLVNSLKFMEAEKRAMIEKIGGQECL